jgi:hypothetical protein
LPFGAPQPHQRVLCLAHQGDAALGKVEKQAGKDDEITLPYFFQHPFFTSQK